MRTLHPDRLKQNLEDRILRDVANGHIGGASVVVCQEGAVVYTHCFGAFTPNESRPLTGDAIFRLASMTKPVTAVATMLLVERGLLRLTDPVEAYLPQFQHMRVATHDADGRVVKSEPCRTKITLLHLLTHTSGIGSGRCAEIYIPRMTDEDIRTLSGSVDYYSRIPLSFEPFTTSEYSGRAAFDVLTAIIEQVTQEDYNTFLRREIFEPCEMQDASFVPSAAQWARMVTMHARVDGKSGIGSTVPGCVFEQIPCTHYLGGAGLISTLDDYANFAEMLLNKGSFKGNRVLDPASVEILSTPHTTAAIQPGNQRWGLGVRVIVDDSYAYLPVGTYGWSGAYGSHFWVDPVNRITAVYMKNSRYDGGSGAQTAFHFEEDVYRALQ